MAATTVVLVVAVLLAMTGGCAAYDHYPLDPNLKWHQPHDLITFDVGTGDYRDFMWNIYTVLLHGSTNTVDKVRAVLHKQDLNNRPFKWLFLELVNGDTKIMLAIRQDNLYLEGFTDATGHWYIFNNKPRWHISGSTPYRAGDSYSDLVGGSRQLGGLRVSRHTTMAALTHIAEYGHMGPAEDIGCVSRALAILVMTFLEATRFQPIMLRVDNGWKHGGTRIAELGELAVNWRRLSCAILIDVGQWNSQEALELKGGNFKIVSRVDAEEYIEFILWPGDHACSQAISLGSCSSSSAAGHARMGMAMPMQLNYYKLIRSDQ